MNEAICVVLGYLGMGMFFSGYAYAFNRLTRPGRSSWTYYLDAVLQCIAWLPLRATWDYRTAREMVRLRIAAEKYQREQAIQGRRVSADEAIEHALWDRVAKSSRS